MMSIIALDPVVNDCAFVPASIAPAVNVAKSIAKDVWIRMMYSFLVELVTRSIARDALRNVVTHLQWQSAIFVTRTVARHVIRRLKCASFVARRYVTSVWTREVIQSMDDDVLSAETPLPKTIVVKMK